MLYLLVSRHKTQKRNTGTPGYQNRTGHYMVKSLIQFHQ